MAKKIDVNKHFSVLKKAEDISFKVLELVNQDNFSNATEADLKKMTKSFKQRDKSQHK